MLKEILQKQISDSFVLSILADITRDKQNIENLARAIRFINIERKISERCVLIVAIQAANAETIFNAIYSELINLNINIGKITSLGFDGAAVMSGDIFGVHTRLIERFERNVSFIHCFNNQLHLAVVEIVGANQFSKRTFELCQELYTLFRQLFES